MLPEGYEIGPASSIEFLRVGSQHSLYYRDLFAHKLGATNSEMHLVLLVDGYVAAVSGMYFQNLNRGQTGPDGLRYLEETYGFAAPSYRYPRLCRLLMMLITTETFLNSMAEYTPNRPDGLATTCLSPYPEIKINRGILKITFREKMRDGRYRIRYAASARKQSYSEVLQEWLVKHGTRQLARVPA